jgi:N utilization substance protein B
VNKLRLAREFCFQYLFHLQLPVFDSIKEELIGDQSKKILRSSINEFKSSTNSLFDDEVNMFVEELISGTLQNYTDVETTISNNLKNWKLSRLSKVDRTNLLLSVYELCYKPSTPVNVVINEAIEISKKFGTKESASFVNGILDNVAKAERE